MADPYCLCFHSTHSSGLVLTFLLFLKTFSHGLFSPHTHKCRHVSSTGASEKMTLKMFYVPPPPAPVFLCLQAQSCLSNWLLILLMLFSPSSQPQVIPTPLSTCHSSLFHVFATVCLTCWYLEVCLMTCLSLESLHVWSVSESSLIRLNI